MADEPDGRDIIFTASEPVLDRPITPTPDQFHRLLLDTMGEGVLACDADGAISFVNRRLHEMHGQGPQDPFDVELHRRQLYDVSGHRALTRDELPLTRTLRGENVHGFEMCIKPQTGEDRWVTVDGNRLLDARGRVVGAVIVIRDITEQRAAEKALQRNQALLAEAQSIAHIGSWEWDLVTNEVFWTTELYRLYGVPETGGPIDYATWLSRVREDERAAVDRMVQQARTTDKPFAFDHHIRRPDGQERILNGRGRVILDDAGNPARMVGTSQDITERKLAVEALHQREAELAEAQRVAHVGNWQWDLHLDRLTGSDEFYRILGLAPDTPYLPMERYREMVHPDDQAFFRLSLDRALCQDGQTNFVYRIRRPDGKVRFVHGQGYNRIYEDGQVVERFGTIQDVTERHEIERAKDEFISVVSHELRTPLTSIRAPLLMLASGRVDAQSDVGKNLLELAVSNTERMVRLVNDIMDMERLARGRISLHRDDVDALVLAHQAADGLEAEAAEAEVNVEVEGPSQRLNADGQRVVQVLTNLLDNAIDFSPPGATVRLAVSNFDGKVRFAVSDDGPGIPQDQLEAVFQRFRQLEPCTTRKKQGLGLGLPISRGIAEQHGGKLWAESRPRRRRHVLAGAADQSVSVKMAKSGGSRPSAAMCARTRRMRALPTSAIVAKPG